MALVIDRFDLRMDGTYRGFEDFCALNARRTDEKYRGSYETPVMKRFAQFANSSHVNEDMEKLFVLIALNCALRNGDAHLKNFGIVYDDVAGRGAARARLRSRDNFRLHRQRQPGPDPQRLDTVADGKGTEETRRNPGRRHAREDQADSGAHRRSDQETTEKSTPIRRSIRSLPRSDNGCCRSGKTACTPHCAAEAPALLGPHQARRHTFAGCRRAAL